MKGENDGFEASLGDDDDGGDIMKTLKLLEHFKKLCSESKSVKNIYCECAEEEKTSGKLDFYVFTLYSIFPFKLMIHHHQCVR